MLLDEDPQKRIKPGSALKHTFFDCLKFDSKKEVQFFNSSTEDAVLDEDDLVGTDDEEGELETEPA